MGPKLEASQRAKAQQRLSRILSLPKLMITGRRSLKQLLVIRIAWLLGILPTSSCTNCSASWQMLLIHQNHRKMRLSMELCWLVMPHSSRIKDKSWSMSDAQSTFS